MGTGRKQSGHPSYSSMRGWHKGTSFPISFPNYPVPRQQPPVGRVIDALHIGCKLFLVLVNDIFTGVPDLIYNTYLRGRQRKYGTYDVGKPVQVVSAGNQYVLHSAGLQICQDTHPKWRTFWFSHPHAKDFFQAVLFQTDTEIDSLVDDFSVVTNLEYNTIHPNDEIDRIQRAVLLFLSSPGWHFVRDDGNGWCGQFYFIDFTHFLFNVGHAHSFGI